MGLTIGTVLADWTFPIEAFSLRHGPHMVNFKINDKVADLKEYLIITIQPLI